MIDQSKKMALIALIKECQRVNHQEILLSPEVYFDGYDENQCNICTKAQAVSCFRFATRLKEVAASPQVNSVYVRFYEYEDALADEDCWIGSDSV